MVRWHSSTRYKNDLKWLQITLQNIPVEQTSSSPNYILFPFYLFGMWQRKSVGVYLKFTWTVALFHIQTEHVCLRVCPQLPLPWTLMTINTEKNLDIFPFAGQLPADPKLKQTEHRSNLCSAWHQVIIWRKKSEGRQRAQEVKGKRDKARGVTQSDSLDHLTESHSTQETLRKKITLILGNSCSVFNITCKVKKKKKMKKETAAWQLNQSA